MKVSLLLAVCVVACALALVASGDPVSSAGAFQKEKINRAKERKPVPCLLGTERCSAQNTPPVKACLVGATSTASCPVDGFITYSRNLMHEIQTEIDIASTPERLWSILTDLSAYPSWNPFIRSITGQIEEGQRLAVSIQPAGGRAMTFRPTVLLAAPNSELRWLGRFLLPGIFDGEHYFKMAASGPGRVRFTQGEQFSGLLVGFAKASLDRGTKDGFVAMNEALKTRAEN